jgi:tRNA-specific 2-thiouridylase
VVQGHDHPWLLSTTLSAQDCSWVAGSAPRSGTVAAKTRYRQADATCELHSASATGCELVFSQAQWAVTPGQSAVLYQGDVCLGGGVIASSNVQNLPGCGRTAA